MAKFAVHLRGTWLLLAVALVACHSAKTASTAQSPAKSGHTYYVDAVAGDDAYRGDSPAQAWKTLTKINATTFSPGDRILLKSGAHWTGQLWPKGSGTEQRPIVIDKFGGDALPVIEANGEADEAVLLKNQEYWEINHLDVTNHGADPAFRWGVRLISENFGEMHHIYVRDLYVHDVNGGEGRKENGGITYNCVGDTKPSRFVDLRLENNRLAHVDRSGIFGWSTHWVRSKWYPSLGVVIRKNTLEDIGGDGIVPVATDGALVEWNVVTRANQRSEDYNVGIWAWSADNTVIQFNEVSRTRGQRDGEGFDSDWNSRNTVIQYNYSHENDGGFVLICNDGSQPARESVGNVGTIVRYNVSRNDHNRGITVTGPITNASIYNNTIVVGKHERVALLLHADWQGWANGTNLYNNIFYVEGQGEFSHGVSRAKDGAYTTAAGFGGSRDTVFDSNVYFGNVKAPDDARAMTSNPEFVGAGTATAGLDSTNGYRLRASSPALNSGKEIPSNGGRDFAGNVVPSCGGIDRGAFESTQCTNQTASTP